MGASADGFPRDHRGWRSDDLIPFERELGDLRGLVLEGRALARPKIVTLAEWVLAHASESQGALRPTA